MPCMEDDYSGTPWIPPLHEAGWSMSKTAQWAIDSIGRVAIGCRIITALAI